MFFFDIAQKAHGDIAQANKSGQGQRIVGSSAVLRADDRGSFRIRREMVFRGQNTRFAR